MPRPPKDPSVFAEPHLTGQAPAPDPSEARAAPAGPRSEREQIEQSVWQEPALSSGPLRHAAPAPELTWADWYEARRRATSPARSWLWVCVVATVAGPFAILGALLSSGQSLIGLLNVVVFGPAVEEVMKIAAASWVVEKRPYLFRSAGQIALTAGAGGLLFAVIENFVYLHVYVPDPPDSLVLWRWTICVALHVGCSLTAGYGLMKVWRMAVEQSRPPRLGDGGIYLIAAVVAHGAYNALAVLLSVHYHF